MIKRNIHLAKLKGNYLFPEIHKRKLKFISDHPDANVISLGIGDTTEPIPHSIVQTMSKEALNLGTLSGYTGYGPEQGIEKLRESIASTLYHHLVHASEVFVSDGAKCDLGRLQLLFGSNISVAIQDPAYPVYVDGSIMHGVDTIIYMPCTPENDFFPDLENTPRTDIIYFCSPNNPTGTAATKPQLEKLVQFAKKNKSIIVFDSAYANFIQDPAYPKSIFEIEGAKEVAIELGSFSKIVGFTGVRLGWTIIPQELTYDDGTTVKNDWQRLTSTIFNGASNIAQWGGIAALEAAGLKEIDQMTHYYLENARIIQSVLKQKGLEVYGGTHAPYLWVRYKNRSSWDVFQELLEKYHIVCTPGSGFGPSGDGFIRFTAFGHRDKIVLAVERFQKIC